MCVAGAASARRAVGGGGRGAARGGGAGGAREGAAQRDALAGPAHRQRYRCNYTTFYTI